MATLIQSPVIEQTGRKLTVQTSSNTGAAPAESSTQSAATAMSAADIQKLRYALECVTQERDAALAQVSALEVNLSEMNRSLHSLEAESEKQGFDRGYQDALQRAEADKLAELENIRLLLTGMADEKLDLIRQAEDAAVAIGFSVAAKILGRACTDIKMVEVMVKQAMQQLAEKEGITVFLSQNDYERMCAYAESHPAAWAAIEIKADETISLGGCRIRSKTGELDASLDTQLRSLADLITRTRR